MLTYSKITSNEGRNVTKKLFVKKANVQGLIELPPQSQTDTIFYYRCTDHVAIHCMTFQDEKETRHRNLN